MSTSPDRAGETVLRGSSASAVQAARFDADLSGATPPTTRRGVEEAHAAARTTGYAEGWAQGQRAARVAVQAGADQIAAARRADDAARDALVRRAVDALGRAADEVAARTVPAVEQIQDMVLRTAMDLAEALLGHELSTAPGRDVQALRRAMADVPGTGPVTVRLHPDDYHTLRPTVAQDESRPVVLVPDARLRPGDAVAESGSTTVDATLAAAVARVKEVLGL